MSGECDCGEHCLDCKCTERKLVFFDHLKNINHPWSEFLYARAVAMHWMREEMNKSNAEIARTLSMDEMQVGLILCNGINLSRHRSVEKQKKYD